MTTADPSCSSYPNSDRGKQDHGGQVHGEQYLNRISYPTRKCVNKKDFRRQDSNILLEYVTPIKEGYLPNGILLLCITLLVGRRDPQRGMLLLLSRSQSPLGS